MYWIAGIIIGLWTAHCYRAWKRDREAARENQAKFMENAMAEFEKDWMDQQAILRRLAAR